MSWKASAFAKATRGHPNITSKAVLMVLADYYNDERGIAWCSQEALAAVAAPSDAANFVA